MIAWRRSTLDAKVKQESVKWEADNLRRKEIESVRWCPECRKKPLLNGDKFPTRTRTAVCVRQCVLTTISDELVIRVRPVVGQ